MKRLLGLYREKQYSPGRHRSNDSLLLEQIANHLRAKNFAVDLKTLPEAESYPRRQAALIFSMCQGRSALENLACWEEEGCRIVNRPQSALDTYRDHLPRLMLEAGIAFPFTRLLKTDETSELNSIELQTSIWLKRGDVHASVETDVQRINSQEQFEKGLADFAERGIDIAAVQEHRAGDEIKFYGIGDNPLFHWFYSRPANEYTFNRDDLANLTRRAAAAAGLDIFGGDVIVSPEGELTLIDLNDWPSFAPCREEASNAIADFIADRVHAS
jgi:glutathione synthase/RimK-type ligase-like ATP-grasp enzyme